DLTQGLLVDAGGAPLPLASKAWTVAAGIPNHGRAAAAVATAVAGLALPLILAHSLVAGYRVPALLASGAAAAASIVLFQASAAGHAPALLGAAPPAMLLAFAAERYRRSP
ncbi:MAG TPA: hypothetical protein VN894_07805, partial [Polyangiaceae bacterium]|nr:hypothetical protein [Polyangiaceae bacterium]